MYEDLKLERYLRCSAGELGVLVAQRRVSPVQLAEMSLSLAKQAEPKLNAYALLLEDYAREVSVQREAEAKVGHLRSALHGVPIAIKDNFYLKGFPVRKGSRTTTSDPATQDSPMIERILAAGAVVIGKTTMPEFGWKGTGSSPLTGVTRNPWNTGCNPGGSSSGSAATVAAGAVAIALGSDAGGSIRIPASFCGVVGLKPTLSRVPVYPGTVTETLSHVGPICRTVDDARLVLHATQGIDSRDPLSFGARPQDDEDKAQRLAAGRLRVAVIHAPFGIAPDPDVARAFEEALQQLLDQVPAYYTDIAPPLPLPRKIFEDLWVTGRGLGFEKQFENHADDMDQGLVRLRGLAAQYTLGQFFSAVEARREFVSQVSSIFNEFDILLTPTMPIAAFAAEQEVPTGGESSAPLPWVTWTPYTYPFNLSGQPAVSIPCGLTREQLPVGMQVVGSWGEDNLVLSIAEQFERCLRFQDIACARDMAHGH